MSRTAGNNVGMPPADSTPPIAVGRSVRDHNRFCAVCGYNLVAIPVRSSCPECGTMPLPNNYRDYLGHCPPGWVGTLLAGVVVLIVGYVISPLAFILFVWFAQSRESAMLFNLGLACGSVITLGGIWMITSRNPKAHSLDGEPWLVRYMLRGASGGSTAMAVGVLTALLFLPGSRTLGWKEYLTFAAFLTGTALSCGRAILLSWHLRDLAERLPNNQLARNLRRAWLGAGVCFSGGFLLLPVYGVGAILLFVGLGYALWALKLLVNLAVALDRCARVARRNAESQAGP